jgi:hypothetical protein
VDECAIHISRLVKRQEDKMSLNKRFSRYGTIVSLRGATKSGSALTVQASVEYSPQNVTGDYATARVLFHERGAAIRAMEHEVSGWMAAICLKLNHSMVRSIMGLPSRWSNASSRRRMSRRV